MKLLRLPETETVFSDRPYSPKAVDSLFSLLKSRSGSATSILTANNDTYSLFLFILENRPYAAGKLTGDRFEPLNLRDYFKALSSGNSLILTFSSITPVLFKCLLVLVQKSPATTGTTDLVNVEGLLQRLKSSGQEAVIIFKHTNELNFFYINKGNMIEAYFSNASSLSIENSLEDQFLEYVYATSSSSTSIVQSYEDMKIEPAEDHELEWENSPDGIVRYFLKPRPELVFLSGESILIKKNIHKKVFHLGRNPNSDLSIPDDLASRDHAIIAESAGEFILEDCQSKNGTMVNKQKVTKTVLMDGDEILIGNTRILFSKEGQEPSQDKPTDVSQLEATQINLDEVSPAQTDGLKNATTQQLSLLFMNGPKEGTVVHLSDQLLIGRIKSDLNLEDSKVSRQHASIQKHADGYHFSDLNSSNGSFINELPVQNKILSRNDIIKVGDTLLKVIEGESLS
jgi:pSer/pThr/pTyr-binding forkhead associated (FHA) protein